MPLDGVFVSGISDEVIRLRHRAADIIQHLGHLKGAFTTWPGSETCLLNALVLAETGHDFNRFVPPLPPLLPAAMASLGLAHMADACSLNNQDDMTGERLVELLRSVS